MPTLPSTRRSQKPRKISGRPYVKTVVQLFDHVTGPSKRVAASLNALTAASARNSARLSAISGKLIGTGAAAFGLVKGLSAPIKVGAQFESLLEDIRQKGSMAAPELKAFDLSLRGIASATNQLLLDTVRLTLCCTPEAIA